jgi:hypothetical protein
LLQNDQQLIVESGSESRESKTQKLHQISSTLSSKPSASDAQTIRALPRLASIGHGPEYIREKSITFMRDWMKLQTADAQQEDLSGIMKPPQALFNSIVLPSSNRG